MSLHPLLHQYEHPDHPGWLAQEVIGTRRYGSTLGLFLVRAGEPGFGWCRMFPDEAHSNLGNFVHGGATMAFIDMALFAGGVAAGANVGQAVTLDCSVQFLTPGRLGTPLDAEVELLRETGRLAFFSGRVLQENDLVATFNATLRKLTA